MSTVFGAAYADAYDVLYRDKDYNAECEMIRELLGRYADQPVTSILDLGCGSGNHAIPLAQAGFAVTGIDRSPSMLSHARLKAADLCVADRATFREGDIRDLLLEERFDATLMMFAVLGYQIENRDVLAAFKTARKHLKPGGIFLFDCWYGPGVLTDPPANRVKTAECITRFTRTTLDTRTHTCHVHFRIQSAEQINEETHVVRFFFPRELELFLDLASFQLLRLGCFPNFDQDPDQTTWNVLGVALALR